MQPAPPNACERADPLEEYKEAANQHRHETLLMYGQLIVFLPASGALVYTLMTSELSTDAAFAVKCMGLALSACFIVLVARPARHLGMALDRAIALEKDCSLQFELYTARAEKDVKGFWRKLLKLPSRLYHARHFIIIIYLLSATFWGLSFWLHFEAPGATSRPAEKVHVQNAVSPPERHGNSTAKTTQRDTGDAVPQSRPTQGPVAP